MGGKSKPRQSEYAPSATEQTQAAIAQADADYFTKTYDPLLVGLRDKVKNENIEATLKGRAGADTMQALTSTSNMPHSSDIDLAGNLATAATGQMLSARVAASQAKNESKLNVLKTARGQRADTGSALAQASRLRASEDLNRIGQKQAIRRAKRQATFQIGSDMAAQSLQNYQLTGNPLSQHLGYAKDTNVLSPTYGDIQQKIGKGIIGGFKTGTQSIHNSSSLGSMTGGTIPSSSSGDMGRGIGTGTADYFRMRNYPNRLGRNS